MDEQYYDVTFIADYFVMTVTAGVPSRENERDYDADPSAIDVAKDIIVGRYGFDPEAYAYDITVEPAF